MTRAKLSGLRRNFAIAIGNSGDEAAICALDESGPDRPSAEDPMVREHVAWARGRTQMGGLKSQDPSYTDPESRV
jgi:epoxyqueuosine reductase QueG